MTPLMPPRTELLAALLDLTHARHSVLAANVANADTPGYKRRDVDFARSLRQLLMAGSAGHRTREQIVIREDDRPAGRDGNNVTVDEELTLLLQNALVYRVATQIVSSRLSLMRRALGGPV